ncbi:MATE family efflux transporter [Streptomyces sp. NPDC090022]|uniref:MATE family efflux transporter n=1 Tax=Streptomyces sp. NPDC090022 TaxID=3365920 RepID=UPI0038021034
MTEPSRPTMRRAWALAGPLLVAGLTQITVNIVDTVMLGHLSTTALSAFAVAAPVHLVALIVVRGWATAVQVQAARFHGAQRPGAVGLTVRVGLAGAVGAALVVGALLYVGAAPVLSVLGASDALVGPGAAYLRVMAFALPFAAISFTLQGACAGIGATRVTMYTALLVNAVNLPLGLLLIFRAELGVSGAALASLAATAAGTCYLLLHCRNRLPAYEKDADTAHSLAGRLWRIGWPEMGMSGIGYLNEALLAGFAARMGTQDLAAYRIVDNLVLVVFTCLASVSSALMILAGQELGAGRREHVAAWLRTGLRMLLLTLAVPAVLAIGFGRPLMALVTEDPGVTDKAWAATLPALLSLVPFAVALGYAAVLRATGDTRSVMIASVVSDYLLLIPLGWFLGLHAGLGLPGIYLAWTAFGLLYAAMLRPRCRRYLRAPAGLAAPAAGRVDP